MKGPSDTLNGYDWPSEPECKDHKCTNPEPVSIAVETPCVTSTTYIWQEPLRTLVNSIPTTHYEEPAPAPPTPVAVAPCEGAYCAVPEQEPAPSPFSVPECEGYGCATPQAEITPTCSGVDCPELGYGGYQEQEPIIPQESDCGAYGCEEEELVDAYGSEDLDEGFVDLYGGESLDEESVDTYGGESLDEESVDPYGGESLDKESVDPYDSKGDFDFDLEELEDDEDLHSHLVDLDLDKETGEVKVNVDLTKVFS